jgi:hypothetical protein
MPKGDNPKSYANLAKAYGGTGKMNTETARKAGAKGRATQTARKKLREQTKREIIERVFDDESTAKVLEKIKELALDGNAEMIKLYAKIAGADKTTQELNKADADLVKVKKDTKRIEADTKKIEAETELIKLKIATPTEEEDDGFFDAIEGRIPDVWDAPEQGGDHE